MITAYGDLHLLSTNFAQNIANVYSRIPLNNFFNYPQFFTRSLQEVAMTDFFTSILRLYINHS